MDEKKLEYSDLYIATDVVITYLKKNPNGYGLSDLYKIYHDKDNKMLYEHIKALGDIFANARKELEEKELEKEGDN